MRSSELDYHGAELRGAEAAAATARVTNDAFLSIIVGILASAVWVAQQENKL